jgi:hypothetical protein
VVSPGVVTAAAVLALIPAMGLLYVYLRRYEGYFDQNRLFFGLLVGLFAGILVRWLETAAFPFDFPGLLQDTTPYTTGTIVYSFAYTAMGFALMETLGKTAIVGFKKFRTRKDTPYYGAAVGIGFGAMWTMQLLANAVQRFRLEDGTLAFTPRGLREAGGTFDASPLALVYDGFLFALCLGLMLTHAASGVWVGRGSGEGRLWKGAAWGSLWLAPGLACYWLWLNTPDQVLPALGALAWGIFAMVIADRKVLLVIVPADVRDMVRRARRREQRKAGREP